MEVLSKLLKYCFRFGPQGLDSGLLLAAIENDIEIGETLEAKAYVKKLLADRNLRISLYPIVAKLLPSKLLAEV